MRCAQILADVQRRVSLAERCVLDVSIARGLDYYTGTVIETFLDRPAADRQRLLGRALRRSWPAFTPSERLAGDRRLAGSGSAAGRDGRAGDDRAGEHARAGLRALFRRGSTGRLPAAGRARLRRAGIGVEVYPEPRKLGQQLKYADRRGFRLALIAGSREFAGGHLPTQGPARRVNPRGIAGRRGFNRGGPAADRSRLGRGVRGKSDGLPICQSARQAPADSRIKAVK